MNRTAGTPLTVDEKRELAKTIGGWELRPCANRRNHPGTESARYCENMACREWYRLLDNGRREVLYEFDELPVDMDIALAWLKKQVRSIWISGGTPGHMWQVRVTRPGEDKTHVLFSRSRNAVRLEDAILRAAYDVMKGIIP